MNKRTKPTAPEKSPSPPTSPTTSDAKPGAEGQESNQLSHKLRSQRIGEEIVAALRSIPKEGVDTP